MFGGTFSPPHIGHLEIARAVIKQLNLAEIIFIPCGDPPHKEGNSVWDSKLRFKLTEMLVEKEKDMSVSDIEILSKDKSYTAYTLQKFKTQNPETEYYFIVGADSLCYMDKWKSPEIIFNNAQIAVVGRDGYLDAQVDDYIGFLTEKYGAVIHKVFMNNIDISSSKLREKLEDGEDISIYTGMEIYKHILESFNGK